jgi:hypothetical protein
MHIVVAYVAPEDPRERIYVCEALGFAGDVLLCRHGVEAFRLLSAGITGIVSVITGDEVSLSELKTIVTTVVGALPVA